MSEEEESILTQEDDGSITYLFKNKLSLTEEEKTRLIFHSFTNVLNILLGFLYELLLFLFLDTIGKCRVCLNTTDETGVILFFVSIC
jgi:hypothetical protein